MPGGVECEHVLRITSGLDRMYIFQPLAVESLGLFDDECCSILADLGRKISTVSGDDRDSTFLFQRISVVIQRHNSILLL